MEQNLQVQPEIRRALNFFASAPLSARGSLLQMPAVSSGADVEISRCECDYDSQGDPLEYVKCSHYCPVHDDCEWCGERKGVMKDPAFPAGYYTAIHKRPDWICQQCADETCSKCGMDKKGGCKCPEEGYCAAHGVLDCLRCAREERYRMHEEERGAIAAEEAMA